MLRFAFLALATLFVTPLFEATAQTKDIAFDGVACTAVFPCTEAPNFNVDVSLFGLGTPEDSVCLDRAERLCDKIRLKFQLDKAERQERAKKSRERKSKGRRN
jgi:hypothetical protein